LRNSRADPLASSKAILRFQASVAPLIYGSNRQNLDEFNSSTANTRKILRSLPRKHVSCGHRTSTTTCRFINHLPDRSVRETVSNDVEVVSKWPRMRPCDVPSPAIKVSGHKARRQTQIEENRRPGRAYRSVRHDDRQGRSGGSVGRWMLRPTFESLEDWETERFPCAHCIPPPASYPVPRWRTVIRGAAGHQGEYSAKPG
jgi:hypothetical protein